MSTTVEPSQLVDEQTTAPRRRRGRKVKAAPAVVPTRPGPRGWLGRGRGEDVLVDAPDEYRGTTVQVCGLWPWIVGSGTPMVGVPFGRHITSGATLCCDPISWFQRANLIAAITNTVLAAIVAAEQTLGIDSPSTVFAQMGRQSGAGYVGGAKTMQPAVAAAGQGLAQAASAGAADLMPETRSSAPAAASSSSRSMTLNVAAGAIVIHAAAGQSEQAIADAGLARLQQLARQAAVS